MLASKIQTNAITKYKENFIQLLIKFNHLDFFFYVFEIVPSGSYVTAIHSCLILIFFNCTLEIKKLCIILIIVNQSLEIL